MAVEQERRAVSVGALKGNARELGRQGAAETATAAGFSFGPRELQRSEARQQAELCRKNAIERRNRWL